MRAASRSRSPCWRSELAVWKRAPLAPGSHAGHRRIAALLTLVVLALVACSDEPPADPPAPRPAFKPDPEIVEFGRRLFRKSSPTHGCATCHGLDARGSRMGPSLRKAAPIYFEKYDHDPKQILKRLIEHMRDPDIFPAIGNVDDFIAPMPPYDRLPPAELEALATFVMSFGATDS